MSLLDRIVRRARERVEDTRGARPLAVIRREGEAAPSRASFHQAIAQADISLVAETKQASPSKGILRSPYDPVALARTYESAGARAISVLTEPDFFCGSPQHLRDVARATELPLLRKDFVVSEDQIWEARAWGASAVLLIAAVLEESQLAEFVEVARDARLDALVEVHTEREAERAAGAGARIVGVNNRDLATFETDLGTTARLARFLPGQTLLVAESGISTRAHVLTLADAGARAILVGEAILCAKDPGRKIRELLGTEFEGVAT